ncbi:MAG: aminotransferase class V-fold PLP-dependent enzyme [Candidatus Eremiobacteraeota bacterium]|nr:aminotransferase class V-fold PLP-dependent enzyme [Candidatus Eremiobacteraeota bacterium]
MFLLDPRVTYLNHGAYGATPQPVFEALQARQLELEREPVDFLSRKATERLAHSRAVLAEYVGCERDDLVYVSNGTTGLNIVARSLWVEPGDEVLTSDHEHGGIDRLWRFMAGKLGFTLVKQRIALPVTTHADFVERFWAGVTPRTRVILLSHLTSPTSLVFPVAEICARARRAGIVTVIDGSHVPGQLPLSIRGIDPDFYVGILHKWVCAPKGCAFLYARRDVQPLLDPLVVSWGWEPRNPGPSTFVDRHEWQGSRDISPFLVVPEALEFQAQHDWDAVRARCKELAAHAQREVCRLAGTQPWHPDAPEWYGQIVCAPLPPATDDKQLLLQLRHEYDLDVSVDRFDDRPRVRISIQGYNDYDDVDRLLFALQRLL